GEQAGRTRAVLGGQDERAGAGHHAELDQLRAEAGRRFTRDNLDHHRAGAVARVVGRMVFAHVKAVGPDAADGQRNDDDQQRDQRGDPAEPAPGAVAPAAAATGLAAAAGPAAAVPGPAFAKVVVTLVTEAGNEPVAGLVFV